MSSFTLVQDALAPQVNAGTISLTLTATTAGDSLIVIVQAIGSSTAVATVSSIATTGGTAYTWSRVGGYAMTSGQESTLYDTEIWLGTGGSGATTVTATMNASTSYLRMSVSEWVGQLHADGSNYTYGQGGTTVTTASLAQNTNTYGADLYIGIATAGGTFTGPSNGYTELASSGLSSNLLVAYAFNGNATTTWTSGAVGIYEVVNACFYVVPSAPSAPTLTAPLNAVYVNVSSGETFSATYNPTDTYNQNAFALRIKTSGAGSYQYYNVSTSSLQSTIVWNPDSVAPGASWLVAVSASALSNGNIYNWSMASQEGGGSVQGAFASDLTFTAQASPTVVVNAPTGTVIGATNPAVTWTDTLPSGATQTNYRVVIESGAFGTSPGSGVTVWDSGVVSSSSTTVQDSTALNSTTSYRVFVQITESGGQTSSWAYSSFTVQATVPATPTLTAVAGADGTTGAPIVTLTLVGYDNQLTLNQSSLESDNTTGWTAGGNTTLAASSTWAQDGSYSLAMIATAAGTVQAVTPGGTSGVPVTAGETVRAMAFYHSPTTVRSCNVQIAFYGSSGAGISQPGSTNVNSTLSGNGGQAFMTAVAPTGAAYAAIVIGGAGLDAPLAAPSTPTVTAEGTTGTTTYDYEVTAINSYGATTPSAVGATTTGNATLSSTNYNLVAWPAVPLAAGSSGNLVYDSNLTNAIASVGPTWKAFGTIGTANGDINIINAGTNSAEMVVYGTGSASGIYNFFDSQVIDVTPGATYTISANINATNLTVGAAYIEVFNTAISTAYATAQQAAGGSGVVSQTFVVPSGVTQVIVFPDLSNATVTAGATVTWSQIQLTETSTVQTYAPGPLWTYDVYGRVSGSPSLIGSTTALAFEDTGQALGAAPPTTNTTNEVVNADCMFLGPGPSTQTPYDALLTTLNPSAWWKLAEAVGSTTAVDSSGNGHTGTVNGGVTFGQTGPITGTPSDTSALFNGTSGSVSNSYNPSGVITVAAWENINATYSGNPRIIQTSHTDASLTGFQMLMGLNNTPSFGVGNGSAYGSASAPTSLTQGWHFIVGTYDGSNIKLYVDGALVAGPAFAGTMAAGTSVLIGEGNYGADFFPGDIAEVSIFPTALTASQVSALYNAAPVPGGTWTTGGFVGSSYANFNFSDDNVNFFAVRNGSNVAIPASNQTVSVVDYEGSLGFNRHYQAQVSY